MLRTLLTLFLAFLWLSAQAQDSTYRRYYYERSSVDLMPGAGYSFYTPRNDTLGTFSGLSVELVLDGKASPNNRSNGPGFSRFYAKLDILNSEKSAIRSLFRYGLGFSTSFERAPKRQLLIPYFGAEGGGISQADFGSSFQVSPHLGMHVVANRAIFLNIQGGYVYPFSIFDELRGWLLSATLNFSLW